MPGGKLIRAVTKTLYFGGIYKAFNAGWYKCLAYSRLGYLRTTPNLYAPVVN